MDEEAQRTKDKQLRVVYGGYSGVITKLIKETDEILATDPLTTKGRSQLNVIHKQLGLKMELPRGLDNGIISCEG